MFPELEKRWHSFDTFISDSHRAITKWMRNDKKSTNQFFHIWHVAGNIAKKMMQTSKEKRFQIIGKWIRAVCNHIYWAATTIKSGFGEIIVDKWSSFIRLIWYVTSDVRYNRRQQISTRLTYYYLLNDMIF